MTIKDRGGKLPTITLLLLFVMSGVLTAQGDETLGIGEREILGPGVNSKQAELMPRINSDGTRIYFIRKNAPGNLGGVEDQDDIYYSDMGADGTWQEAVNIGEPLNTTGSDVLFWISPDEKTALLYHGRRVNGKERGLSIARKKGNKWEEPEALKIKGLKTVGNWYAASLSSDLQYLLISYAPNPEREFNLDLFYATRVSDDLTSWSRPQPITMVNSPFIESSPWLAADGRTLFYISDRPESNGLADVFVTRRPTDSWDWWSPPEPLGYTVNTSSFEADVSLSADEKWLYTSRVANLEKTTYGRSDIYRNPMPEVLGSQIISIIKGKLTDEVSGAGVRGKVTLSMQRQGVTIGEISTDPNGQFSMMLLPGHLLTLAVKAPGYEDAGSLFDGRFLDPWSEKPEVVIAMKRKSGEAIPKRPDPITLLFPTGGTTLSRSSIGSIRRFAEKLQASGGGIVYLDGYTDSVGTTADNLTLAEKRADAVASVLRKSGIAAGKIVARGLGEANPTGDNGTAAGRRANRRVELRAE